MPGCRFLGDAAWALPLRNVTLDNCFSDFVAAFSRFRNFARFADARAAMRRVGPMCASPSVQ
jgi:hypothetical protein